MPVEVMISYHFALGWMENAGVAGGQGSIYPLAGQASVYGRKKGCEEKNV